MIVDIGVDLQLPPHLNLAGDLAEWLYAEGIRGRPRLVEDDPFSKYMRRQAELVLSRIEYCGVVAYKILPEWTKHNGYRHPDSGAVTGYARIAADGHDFQFDLPQVVLDFVWFFDRGAYPHLEEK